METLQPYRQLPRKEARKNATILLDGLSGVGKRTLSKALEYCSKNCLSLQIRTTTTLPLPTDPTRPRIDFIVFMIDMTNQLSLDTIRNHLNNQVDHDYLFGRSCLVVSKIDHPTMFAFPTSELGTFADYCLPTFLTNLSDNNVAEDLSLKIIKLIATANHHTPFVSPLLLRGINYSLVASTTLTQETEVDGG